VATDSIKTVGAPAKLVLKPDRTTLDADGNDVSCIEVDICDADNNSIITANNPVQFTMTGPGRSVGIASGDWTSNEPFKATSRKAHKGKVLIVIQSTLIPGTIGLTVTSPGLPPATLTLKSWPGERNAAPSVPPARSIHPEWRTSRCRSLFYRQL
jgi:beta-galactosidase